jgi:alpha-D-xyloside xylohydrolase
MEQIAIGVWRLRWGTPELHTPVSLRSTEIRKEALNGLACEGIPLFPVARGKASDDRLGT